MPKLSWAVKNRLADGADGTDGADDTGGATVGPAGAGMRPDADAIRNYIPRNARCEIVKSCRW